MTDTEKPTCANCKFGFFGHDFEWGFCRIELPPSVATKDDFGTVSAYFACSLHQPRTEETER